MVLLASSRSKQTKGMNDHSVYLHKSRPPPADPSLVSKLLLVPLSTMRTRTPRSNPAPLFSQRRASVH